MPSLPLLFYLLWLKIRNYLIRFSNVPCRDKTIILLFLIAINLICSALPACAEVTQEESVSEAALALEPIVIIPTKSSLIQSQDLRKVKIITGDQISRLPVTSVAQLMQHVLGIDIRQRGAAGVQADVNIRGANFEQVVISIDGVRLNDPQTGHHNMDLPITLMDIQRIELLPGHGSSLYGPAAFGGTLNIVTKPPQEQELILETSGGSFGLNSQAFSLTYPVAGLNNRFSFSRKESTGYRPETDFETTTLSYSLAQEFTFGDLEYLFGYSKKDFGADSFYSNLYPREEEHTDTRFFNLKASFRDTIWQMRCDLYYRRHTDKFILDRDRPSWYVNYHTSYSYGGDLEAYAKFAFGSLFLGAELGQEKISSTNLGNHVRDWQAVYGQYQTPPELRATANLGLRLDHYQTWGWEISPSLSLGYKLQPQLQLKACAGRSFRIPSFTDLYYSSPANVGNENLTPEEAWSAETGLSFNQGFLNAEVTYFRRWAEDLISWTRATSSEAWNAQNIAKVKTQGLECEFVFRDLIAFFPELSTGYVYQYSESEDISLNTKYALEFLKHHAHVDFELALPGEFSQNLRFSYKQRIDQRHYFLLDSRISKRIAGEDYDWEIFLDISNLLNTSYSEQGEVAMPGRWIIAGVRIEL